MSGAWNGVWSEEQLATLKALWGKERASVIALAVGKSSSAILGKAHRLGLPAIPRGDRIAFQSAGVIAAFETMRGR